MSVIRNNERSDEEMSVLPPSKALKALDELTEQSQILMHAADEEQLVER